MKSCYVIFMLIRIWHHLIITERFTLNLHVRFTEYLISIPRFKSNRRHFVTKFKFSIIIGFISMDDVFISLGWKVVYSVDKAALLNSIPKMSRKIMKS